MRIRSCGSFLLRLSIIQSLGPVPTDSLSRSRLNRARATASKVRLHTDSTFSFSLNGESHLRHTCRLAYTFTYSRSWSLKTGSLGIIPRNPRPNSQNHGPSFIRLSQKENPYVDIPQWPSHSLHCFHSLSIWRKSRQSRWRPSHSLPAL